MARTAREIVPGKAHLIVIKTIPELTLFRDKEERCLFLSRLSEKATEYRVKLGDHAQLAVHGHFVLTPSTFDGIANVMRSMLTWWGAHLNRTHANGPRKGRVFQDRYLSILIHNTQQHLTVSRYVQRSSIGVMPGVEKAEDYLFSSTRLRLGLSAPIPIQLEADELVRMGITGDGLREFLAVAGEPISLPPRYR